MIINAAFGALKRVAAYHDRQFQKCHYHVIIKELNLISVNSSNAKIMSRISWVWETHYVYDFSFFLILRTLWDNNIYLFFKEYSLNYVSQKYACLPIYSWCLPSKVYKNTMTPNFISQKMYCYGQWKLQGGRIGYKYNCMLFGFLVEILEHS